jgi:hypothetical protein
MARTKMPPHRSSENTLADAFTMEHGKDLLALRLAPLVPEPRRRIFGDRLAAAEPGGIE